MVIKKKKHVCRDCPNSKYMEMTADREITENDIRLFENGVVMGMFQKDIINGETKYRFPKDNIENDGHVKMIRDWFNNFMEKNIKLNGILGMDLFIYSNDKLNQVEFRFFIHGENLSVCYDVLSFEEFMSETNIVKFMNECENYFKEL